LSLDFLRGVAVLLVMLEHYEVTDIFVQVGWSGVDLFFVLSGFFISGILFKEYKQNASIKPLRFLLRRGLKIWPLFYFALALHVGYYYIKHTPVSTERVLADAFFYQNYKEGVLAISWSLGVEEQFYLFVALCFWIVLSIPKRSLIPFICLIAMITSLILRIINYSLHPDFTLLTHHFPTQFRMDALMFGILISYFFHFYFGQFQNFIMRFRFLLLLIGCFAAVPLFIWHISDYRMNTVGLTLNYLSYGIFLSLFLVLSLKSEAISRSFTSRWLLWVVWIGQYSYAIYLFHFSFGFGIANFVRKNLVHSAPHLFYSLIYLISNILIGYLASTRIEQPILRLRDKYFPAIEKRKNLTEVVKV
jgi:peptidoglycan/LPS O-acetylase OafA/YrhL